MFAILLFLLGTIFAAALEYDAANCRRVTAEFGSALSEPALRFAERLNEMFGNRQQGHSRQERQLREVLELFKRYVTQTDAHKAYEELLTDETGKGNPKDMAELDGEKKRSEKVIAALAPELRDRLVEYLDPMHQQTKFFLEIDSAGGGDDTASHVQNLTGYFARLGSANGWKVTEVSSQENEHGVQKHIVLEIEGASAYRFLKFEAGQHRIEYKKSSKVHTSTVNVSLWPKVDAKAFTLQEADVEITTQRGSGPGGQKVNKTDSAVRAKHVPTGLSVLVQDERSQAQNKTKALELLAAKVSKLEADKAEKKRVEDRARAAGTARPRAEPRIRTYDLGDNRITDHRTGQKENQKMHSVSESITQPFYDGLQGWYLENLLEASESPAAPRQH
ncbi:MAG: PCRF domain-containing protein [Deltaproteobacteria bacterium]|nr:PCRF domain-containing protein [Deltaproteobacteria bacterium]